MNEIDIWLVDSFTGEPLTGNPAGVVLDAEGLTEADCSRIAAEIGCSETAFVLPAESEGADFRVRFFSPSQEVDLCGHATLAAFWTLASEGRISLEEGENRIVQQTAVGNLPVWVEMKDGKPVEVWMGQKLPRFETPEVNLDKLAALFGVGRKNLIDEHPVEIVSTGLRSLHIPMAGLACFSEIKVLTRSLLELSNTHEVTTIQLFAPKTDYPAAQFHARVFAPAVGVGEDPVTGTASGALGAYVVRHGLLPEGKDGITSFVVEQGGEIGRPGFVHVEVERDDEEFVGIRAGGEAIVSLTGKLRIRV
ncbi:MAG: PhzF family phenazine biosynthesis protein [Planctomycetota bacterium]